ncbi:MAG: hypothetical protein WDM90_22155 [Ferruginibacter sp.]
MAPTPHSPWHKEVSALSFFISLPQLIASPIIVGIQSAVHAQNVVFELKEILDFLVISFPLTLGVAVLFVIIERGEFNLFYMLFAIVGAALLSNLLHYVIEEMPLIDVGKALNDSYDYKENTGGNITAFRWVGKIFGIYWKTFGPVLFIQSLCIGIYAGYKYVKIEEKKKKEQKKKR